MLMFHKLKLQVSGGSSGCAPGSCSRSSFCAVILKADRIFWTNICVVFPFLCPSWDSGFSHSLFIYTLLNAKALNRTYNVRQMHTVNLSFIMVNLYTSYNMHHLNDILHYCYRTAGFPLGPIAPRGTACCSYVRVDFLQQLLLFFFLGAHTSGGFFVNNQHLHCRIQNHRSNSRRDCQRDLASPLDESRFSASRQGTGESALRAQMIGSVWRIVCNF